MKPPFLFLAALCPLLLRAGAQTALAPLKYLTIPLGKIKPSGWLMDQLKVQTNGLAGHQHEFYAYVSQTDWMGGNSYYSNLEEAGSYCQPHSNQCKSFRFPVLRPLSSRFNGVLGPEVNTTKPRYLWGRYPFMFGAIQMLEYDPSLTDQVVTALHKFVVVANAMLHAGQGVDAWAQTRWEDFVMVLQWLYDYHPNGKEDLLIDTMKYLKWTGVPWEKVFSEQNPFGLPLTWHGVNMAEGLKALPSTYRFTHNQTDLDVASKGWDMLFEYHGRPSGIYSADEYLAGLEAVRGTELCLVVETMFSGSYLYQVMGDPKFADRVEKITYNALPATLTGDMWSRQYLQQQNQIAAKNMNPNPFPNDGAYSNVFGLEPNYPCCTVNHPQGWPKFITNAFLMTPDKKSLVHLYLGPFETTVTLDSENQVKAVVDTQYPFSDVLTTRITATKAFTYYVRIPSWVVGGTIAIDGRVVQPVAPVNGLQAVSVKAGTTLFVLNLPAPVTTGMFSSSSGHSVPDFTSITESRPHGSIAVHRGPLHYAFDIPRNQTVLARNAQQPLAVDLQFDATAPWQYAIDPATLKFAPAAPPATLPSPIFDSGKPPVSITVSACPISWPIAGDTFAAPPPTNPTCTGSARTIRLTPFGATKLRIGEFPVVQLG
ncbi:hypothetical protein NLJ89_g4191 [Agrocybe chaxingu]|uniref:Uncharacterized protein n=1 Tax=Agrocybe chaxingu TaxID=84603 RepID=A0A9W8MW61_9AGAR|nr:hypothetical protein NLJ89_g4191 [Agrocybe chaxingu]